MSEPVGNGPRTPIPGNSHSEKTQNQGQKEQRESLEKITKAPATLMKQPLYKRMAKSMVADDAQTVGEYLVLDVLLPAVKNLIRDVVVGGIERTLYGSTARSTRRPGVRDRDMSIRERYAEIQRPGEPRRMMSREAKATHDFREVVLTTREEALDVIEALMTRVEKYGSASVADLYDLCGVTGSYMDQKWGWLDLRDAEVRQMRGNWLLDLPAPEPLR